MATQRVAPSLWAALAATVSAGGLVMMAEIDRLVASSSSPAYPSAALYGPFHLFATDQRVLTAWNGAASGDVPALATWLHEQLVADLLFLAGYTALLLVIDRRFRLRLTAPVVAVGLADLLEDVAAWFVFEPTAPGATDLHVTGPLVSALAVVTQAKWLALLVLLIGLVFRLWQRYVAGQDPAGAAGLPPAARVRAARRAAREAMHALFHQRFSLIVVGLLALMTVVPSGGVLDQAPDIIRRLLPAGGSPPDWVRLVATAISTAGLCAALVYLGAVRAYGVLDERASTTPTADPIDQRVLSTGAWWLVGAGLGAAVLGVLMALGLVAPDLWAFGLPATALLIGLASLLLRWRGILPVPLRPRPGSPQTFARTRHIGRLLAYSVPVVVFLAAARAITPVLALDGGSGLALVLLPVAGAGAVWLVLALVLKRSGPLARESGSSSPLHPRVAGRTDTGSPGLLRGGRPKSAILLTAIAFAAISALLVVLPLWYGSAVGLLAVMMTSFTGLAALFATISIWIQRVAPPRLFQVMALRRTPAVTLLVLVAVITNVFAVSSPHDVRTPSAAANTAALRRWQSTTWEAAVTDWLRATTGPGSTADGRTCTPPRTSVDDAGPHATGPITVRPMVFLALEGGGMRAAYWAADFLKGVLVNRCLAGDVVAVSSVSGGSVGLATVEALGDGALGAVRRMAGQDGLSATVDALLTRDLLAGSYGIDVTAPHQDYLDRAALLAAAWQRAVPAAAPSGAEPLASPYPLGAFADWGDGSAGTAKVPWVSVFNATSALTGCVVTMSTVDLGVQPGADPQSSCGAGQLPASYQLFAKDPRYAGLPLVDAALLSARFGVISPSGVLRTNRGDVADQLIDGGYAENTGLATIDGLLSSAVPLVRAHNAAELAAPGATTDLVVPVVIALSNDPTALARDAKPAKPTDELTLPLTSRLRAGAALVSPEALKTRAAAIAGGYLPPIADPARAKQISLAVARTVWRPVITLAPTAQPGVAVPLGWALSSTTMTAMDDALRCITRDPIYSAGRATPACARSADQDDNDAFVHLSGAVR